MPVWPTLIIVSGWEWYGLAEKCNVLPFYILNSGSHEPLQGDASSDFKRNFNLDAPCYLSPSEPSNVKTAPAFLFFLSYQTSGSGPSCAVVRRAEQAVAATAAATPGNVDWPSVLPDIGLFWSQTPGTVHSISPKTLSPCRSTASLFAYLTEPSLTCGTRVNFLFRFFLLSLRGRSRRQ